MYDVNNDAYDYDIDLWLPLLLLQPRRVYYGLSVRVRAI